MINQMVNYIEIKYKPIIKGINILNSKQKILHVTGPDSFTNAINTTIRNNDNKLLHRSIDYNNYFKINGSTNYINMYKINNKKHYSEYNEPLYK